MAEIIHLLKPTVLQEQHCPQGLIFFNLFRTLSIKQFKIFKQLKGHSSQVFTPDQNLRKSLNCILTKLKLSTSYCFQDIAVQSLKCFSYISLAILPVFREKKKNF